MVDPRDLVFVLTVAIAACSAGCSREGVLTTCFCESDGSSGPAASQEPPPFSDATNHQCKPVARSGTLDRRGSWSSGGEPAAVDLAFGSDAIYALDATRVIRIARASAAVETRLLPPRGPYAALGFAPSLHGGAETMTSLDGIDGGAGFVSSDDGVLVALRGPFAYRSGGVLRPPSDASEVWYWRRAPGRLVQIVGGEERVLVSDDPARPRALASVSRLGDYVYFVTGDPGTPRLKGDVRLMRVLRSTGNIEDVRALGDILSRKARAPDDFDEPESVVTDGRHLYLTPSADSPNPDGVYVIDVATGGVTYEVMPSAKRASNVAFDGAGFVWAEVGAISCDGSVRRLALGASRPETLVDGLAVVQLVRTTADGLAFVHQDDDDRSDLYTWKP